VVENVICGLSIGLFVVDSLTWVMLYGALKMVFARTVLVWGGMVYVADELLEVGKLVMKEVGLKIGFGG
jgi:hypothetical protein